MDVLHDRLIGQVLSRGHALLLWGRISERRIPLTRLAPLRTPLGAPRSFFAPYSPKCVENRSSQKFACSILHKPSARAMRAVSTGLRATCEDLHVVAMDGYARERIRRATSPHLPLRIRRAAHLISARAPWGSPADARRGGYAKRCVTRCIPPNTTQRISR